jgi:hypothetical protein
MQWRTWKKPFGWRWKKGSIVQKSGSTRHATKDHCRSFSDKPKVGFRWLNAPVPGASVPKGDGQKNERKTALAHGCIHLFAI